MNRSVPFRPLALLTLLTTLSGCQLAPPLQQHMARARFDFALLGDVPYSEGDATNAFVHMIEDINRHRLAFAVHDGDIKSGADPCSDVALWKVYDQFQTFRHPLIYVFGDNEWSDCGKNRTEPYQPEERLAKLREIFCSSDRSLGRRTLRLTRQSDQDDAFGAFPENVRWSYGNVLFIGLNVPGADNHFGTAEYQKRNRANLAWLREGFAEASGHQRCAVMIILQANPHFELAPTNKLRAGFNDLLSLLEKETVAFKKPVVLVHGDSHYFRIDKPLISSITRRRIENFTRVETFGNPDVHWIRTTVDWRNPAIFTFRPQIVPANVIKGH